MSKIYEALLRAEQDRNAEQKSAASPAPVEPLNRWPMPGATASAIAIPDAGKLAIPSPLQAESAVFLSTATPASPPALHDAQRRLWNPLHEHLPALQPRGQTVEQFRRLRSQLFEYRGANRLKTILVSSAVPGEGKSFVVANLAISLTRQSANRVLVIDADLRQYSLHELFGTDPGPGLGDYLRGRATPEEILQLPDEATIDAMPDLAHIAFIPGGTGQEREGDLSGSSRFEDLIRWAAPHFDWILVDSSPVTLVSDAVNLAHSCDAALLVVRSGVTRYEDAQRARGELQGTNVIGVVLNGVEKVANGYHGYFGESGPQ